MVPPMTTDTPHPSWSSLKRGYAIGVALVGAVSLTLGAAITAYLGGDGQSIVTGAAALAIGVLLSLAPVLIKVPRHAFGFAVVGASGARLLLAMAVVVIATAVFNLPRRPLGLGVAAALGLSLVAETVLALAVLSRVHRKTELA